ncbi:MAG: CoA-binding protein [Deltaproteobacteria bacterium]|nr:CoA-binding protein [Deltaproteobacteria bacterium]
MGNGKKLDFFFNPASIAVVGATPTPGKISNIVLESLKNAGFQGDIYPVNPGYKTIDGSPCYPSIKAIGKEIDMAVFAVPAQSAVPALKEAKGCLKSAVVISGGFAETDEAGRLLEKELRDIARHGGIRIIGPNCMGIYDTVSKTDTFFIPPERIKRPSKGGLSIISQSGSFAVTAMDELASEGIGVARVVSYGNKADVNESDCLEFLAADTETKAIAVYIESIEEGRRFVEAASSCSVKKPVMAIKAGRSDPAVFAARSHTGALAGRYEVYRAAFRKAGIIELTGYEEFISGCKAFGMQTPARGGRVMIITDGGGMGVGIADASAASGLDAAPLPEAVAAPLKAGFPRFCAVTNPMDLTGSATDELFAEAIEKTMSGDNYDIAIVAALWGPPALTDEMPELIAEKARICGKPVIICTPGGDYTREKMALFRKFGLPVFSTPESAVRAASILARGHRVKRG